MNNLEAYLELAKQIPLWLIIVGLCILPSLPVPAALTYFVGGSILALHFGVVWASIICLLCDAIAFTWFYYGVKKFCPQVLMEKVINKFPLFKTIHQSNPWNVAFIVRFCHGVPLIAQTLFLSFLKVPFIPFLVASVCAQAIIIPLIIGGGAAMVRSLSNPLIGLAGLVCVIILLFVTSKLKNFIQLRLNRDSATQKT